MSKGKYRISSGNIVLLRGDRECPFEQAQFIVRNEDDLTGDDIIKEADRIINEYSERKTRRAAAREKSAGIRYFTIGLVLGFVVCCISFIIFNTFH